MKKIIKKTNKLNSCLHFIITKRGKTLSLSITPILLCHCKWYLITDLRYNFSFKLNNYKQLLFGYIIEVIVLFTGYWTGTNRTYFLFPDERYLERTRAKSKLHVYVPVFIHVPPSCLWLAICITPPRRDWLVGHQLSKANFRVYSNMGR